MIEYLHDAIRAVAGQEIAVNATITDDLDMPVTTDCKLILHDDDTELFVATGIYLEEDTSWTFNIPANVTTGLSGRYWYDIQHEGNNLCFKKPIYLV